MQIQKSGFYLLSDLLKEEKSIQEIHISDGLTVSLLDDTGGEKCIWVWKNVLCDYFGFFHGIPFCQTHILGIWDASHIQVNTIIFSYNNHITSKIIGELRANNITIDMNILSFAGEGGNIKIDGILQVNQGTQGCVGRLEEENIFLWEDASISGFPTLLVATNDVQASHSCKMEKISDESLFYLRSRGIEKENALSLMIESKIVNLFCSLAWLSSDFYEKCKREIFEKIY